MKCIGSVLRNILDVAHNMMLSLGAVLKSIDKGFNIHQRVDWILIVLLHCVDPYVYVTVNLTHRELP
jgi:hypothetical protein